MISDEHFLDLNVGGDRVYLYACKYCGKDKRQHETGMSYEDFTAMHGTSGGKDGWKLTLESNKRSWAEGGTFYNTVMKRTTAEKDDGVHHAYAISGSRFVTAKTSGWTTAEMQNAASRGLIDTDLLGGDYTKAATRLQFCSVAVKVAEWMTGKAIAPAPSGTFTDTDSEYARKAFAVGITADVVRDSQFAPESLLTRQEMVAFLYRALMYVKDNSDTEYTVWTSRLDDYADAGQVAAWAKEPMAFMNALGLISGTSGKPSPPRTPALSSRL